MGEIIASPVMRAAKKPAESAEGKPSWAFAEVAARASLAHGLESRELMNAMDAVATPSSAQAAPAKHIVDVLIEERAKLISGWLLKSSITGPFLRRIFLYDDARKLADELAPMLGETAFDLLAQRLSLNLSVTDFDTIPKSGATIVVANHPTGLADGIAIWQSLRRVRRDLIFFANADALRAAPKFDDIIIPIEWRVGMRSPAKSKVALAGAIRALAEGKCLVIFPSGIPAIPSPIMVDEQPWLPTFVSLAAKTGAPVIPVAMRADNSMLFYVFCILNKPLRHMSLFREFLNKKNAAFALRALQPERFHSRPSNAQDLASKLRARVALASRELSGSR